MEDYDLELRLLKKYGKVYSLNESLVYYRIHSNQLTFNGVSETPENKLLRAQIVKSIINL